MEQAKRGNASIEAIKYLSRADYFCMLIDGALKIITQQELKPVHEIKNRNIKMFCLNQEVYRVNSQAGPGRINSVSQTDQICVCTKQN